MAVSGAQRKNGIGGEQMWGGQDKGSPIWCLLDKAAES